MHEEKGTQIAIGGTQIFVDAEFQSFVEAKGCLDALPKDEYLIPNLDEVIEEVHSDVL